MYYIMKVEIKKSNVTIPMKLERNPVVTSKVAIKSSMPSNPQPLNKMYTSMFQNIKNTKSCGSCGK